MCKEQFSQPLISVIVPVYNVEDYIERCLDSLYRQSLVNIEIILIDDASTDRCSAICQKYAKQDSRFKIFHHTHNKGLSAARNTGIRMATANYLMFVDSDDWVADDFCKAAYECVVHYHADLVLFRAQYQRRNNHFTFANFNHRNSSPSGYKTRLEAMDLLMKGVGQTAWNKLYKKELFNTVAFPEGYIYEDIGTTYKLVWQAENIYYLNEILYYHCSHEGSITTIKGDRAFHDWYKMSMQQYNDLAAWAYPAQKLDSRLKKIALSYCVKKKKDLSDPTYLSYLEIIRSAKMFPEQFTIKGKLLFVLLKLNLPLFEFVCVLFNQKLC